MDPSLYAAYCGAPADPANWATRWIFDPLALAVIAGVAFVHLKSVPAHRRAIAAGWAVVALTVFSPLCALSVSLFSARVGQHLIFILIAAPLLARGWRGPAAPLAAGAVFSAFLWLWHAPAPYDATFRSVPLYWMMHLSLLASATWLWAALERAPWRGVVASALVAMQMSALAALLTFAPTPWFPPHLTTSWAFGLSPLADQQFGGVLMWTLGGGAFAALALIPLWRALEPRPATE
jgi:putative membrane protein